MKIKRAQQIKNAVLIEMIIAGLLAFFFLYQSNSLEVIGAKFSSLFVSFILVNICYRCSEHLRELKSFCFERQTLKILESHLEFLNCYHLWSTLPILFSMTIFFVSYIWGKPSPLWAIPVFLTLILTAVLFLWVNRKRNLLKKLIKSS